MNTFGGASEGLQFPLYDVREALESRSRFRREGVDLLRYANSLYCPAGRLPARGWLLMARVDYDQLDRYSTTLQLNVGDTTLPDNVGTFKNLSIVQARCVTRGLASDSSALYLIEVTDARGILHNRWFQFPTTSAYNIRSPAYPDTFQIESMEDYPAAGPGSKTTWTWTSMLQNLWEQMPLLKTWPGLPYAPVGTPEGFWFSGVPAWYALCDVLDYLGLDAACDLTAANPYTIVSSGADDATFTTLQARYATNLEDDHEWIDVGAGRVPKTIKVLFRRRNAVYGTEETVTYRNDGPYQWDMAAIYPVSVAAPAAFSSAIGTHHIWSDFTVRYDMDSIPFPEDVAIAASIAAERTQQYFDRIYSRTSGSMDQTYTGALPFSTGSQVDGVCWYQDYTSRDWLGWRTRLVRAYPPFPDIYSQQW